MSLYTTTTTYLLTWMTSITTLSIDELSNILSFIPQKELIKCCIIINKSFNSAIFYGNSWKSTRLSSRQLFKCKNDKSFINFAKYSWSNLSKFTFMNYKTWLNSKQKEILKKRLLLILNSSHKSLANLQLHGVDISLYNDLNIKLLQNLNILWIVTPKRDDIIHKNVWKSLVSSPTLITLEIMSNFALNLQDIKQLILSFKFNQKTNLKNLKLTIKSDIKCNQEIMKLIDLLSNSLEIIVFNGIKYIDNQESGIIDCLSKCKNLIVLSLMYRNKFDTTDLYSNIDCFNLLYHLSFSTNLLKVLSIEYGPIINHEWNEKYKNHIQKYFKSLIWVKIGQNRVKNPFLSTIISPNVKCNRFCLSWNANPSNMDQ